MIAPATDLELAAIFAGAALAGYLVGSIPFGLLLTRLAGLGDIRKMGSGNIGATNVLRTGKKGLAALTLVLDGTKGAAPVLVAGAFFSPIIAVIAGAAAFLGHLYPVWLGFRGGKGVATFIGVLLGINWHVGLAVCLIWIATVLVFRLSSLAALVAAAASPLLAWFLAPAEVVFLSLALAVAIFARHSDNIKRLIDGTEPCVGGGSDPK